MTDHLNYVAIGPQAFGFGDTRDEAVANCKRNISWGSLRDHYRKHGVVVRSYAYKDEQSLAVSHVDGSIGWQKKDAFDVVGSRQEHTIKQRR